MEPRNGTTNYDTVGLDGTSRKVGAETITVLLYDPSGNILMATGTTKPTNSTAGYAKGAIFIDTDVAAGTGSVNLNKGDTAACEFTLVTQA